MSVNTFEWKNRVIVGRKWLALGWLGVFLLSVIVSLLLLYEYILPLDMILLDRDYVIQLWNLWLVNEAIQSGQNPYVTDLIYYPVGANLARYTLSPGFFPVTLLVDKLSGGDRLYPLYTFSFIILLSISLNLFFSYLTLKEIGLTFWAAAIPAVAYAFSDFYMNHLWHMNILSCFFIAAIAFFLIRLFKKPRRSTALICSILTASAFYFTEFALFICIAISIFIGLMLLFFEERRLLLDKLRELGLKTVLVSVIAFVLVLLPFLLNWFASDALPPDPVETVRYSSNLAGFFIPTQKTTPLYGSLFSSLNKQLTAAGTFTFGVTGFEIFIGFPLLLLGLVSLFTTRQRLVRISALVALIFFVLSLGPTLKIFTFDTGLLMPYSLLASIPPFDVGRTPVRLMVIGLFFWMIVAAFGLRWLQKAMLKYGQSLATVTMILIFLWVIVEVYSPLQKPHKIFVVPPQLEEVAEGPVITLPLKFHHGWALLFQIFHGQPLATGEVSRNSKMQHEHFETLQVYYADALQTGSCGRFMEMGFRNIIILSGVSDDVAHSLLHSSTCPMKVIDLRE